VVSIPENQKKKCDWCENLQKKITKNIAMGPFDLFAMETLTD